MELSIKKFDDELQVVYGEIYAPNVPDAQGDFMTATEVRKMAHKFMHNLRLAKVDTMHDNEENGSYFVESFIAREDDPVFLPGSWVGGVHIPDRALWARTKKGEFNGFSLEAMVTSKVVEIEIEVPDVIEGETHKAEGHAHNYFVRFNDAGEFVGGSTSTVDGHSHEITRATVTEPGRDGHTHRFSILEAVHLLDAGS